MTERPGAGRWVPEGATLDELRSAAQSCRGCELYQHATQAVVGEGPADARLMVLGEQPGDKEDQQGEPFVGPAGVAQAPAWVLPTTHPSAVLRSRERQADLEAFVADLEVAAGAL